MNQKPSNRPRDPGLRRFWNAALVALVLGFAGFFGARPAYRWVKAVRARRLVEQTVPAVTAGRWEEVGKAARIAVGLAPDDPRVRWLTARLYSAGGRPEALALWDSFPPGSLSPEDRFAWAQVALSADRLDLATTLINGLLEKDPDAPRILHLAMLTAERQGDPMLALRMAARWHERHPDDLDGRWHFGSRLQRASDPALRGQGRRTLLELTATPNPFRVLAGGVLSDDPELPAPDRVTLLARLREMEAPPLVIDSLEYHLQPERRPAILGRVVERTLAETNRVIHDAALTWLNQHQGTEAALGLLTPERVAGDARLTQVRIQALLEVGRTAEAHQALEAAGSGVGEPQRHCFAAWEAHSDGRPEEADAHLVAALGASRDDPAVVEVIAGYALRLGRPRPALRALERLVARSAGRISAARLLVPIALRQNDLESARNGLDALRTHLPGDPNVRSLATYLRFLQGEGRREDLVWLIQQAESGDVTPLARVARALGRWRLGEAEIGLAEVESLPPGMLEADPRLRMAHAILLSACQRREAARAVARGLAGESLLAEERLLLEQEAR